MPKLKNTAQLHRVLVIAIVLMLAMGGMTVAQPLSPVINEFSASTTGTDIEYVEIFGLPNTDYTHLTILEIEGDTTGAGVIDEIVPVGSTNSLDLWYTDLPANSLENGTITLLLVEGFTGSLSQDLDIENDGTFDITPWTTILDSVAVNDGGAGDITYSETVLFANYDGMAFAPGGASRIPDGTDTGGVTDWIRNDFDLFGIPGYTGTPVLGEAKNTPGSPNELVPEPTPIITLIHDVQGSGEASPLVGQTVIIEAIVVGDYQDGASGTNGDLDGFYIQEENDNADADPLTSEGIFIYDGSAPAVDVNIGDLVSVEGVVSEHYGMTEITSLTDVTVISSDNDLPMATSLTLPVTAVSDFESYEGMLITFPQELIIAEYFNFDRYGEIVLTSERHLTPTAEFEPGSNDVTQAVADYLLDKITLDDGRESQNPDPAIHPNGEIFTLDNLFRGGDAVENVTGIMDYDYGIYRIQPTQGADYTASNPRPDQPDDTGGNLKVASFNVLNYFITFGERGADNAEEFERQRDKIVAALAAIDADVVGLIEIENYPGDEPTADLVSGLNDVLGAGTYSYIATGAIGTDEIRVAMIYKPASVSPLGDYAILDSTVDPRFIDTLNRPTLAQTFMDDSTGGIFTVAINHLKSKGSACPDDPDIGDGAGNCNLTRTAAAQALVDWLSSDPTGSGDSDFLIIGDLNSYDKEDPIDAIIRGADDILGTGDDYTDLAYELLGEDAYSYVFDGQIGYLDYALASAELFDEITG
ncbi:MAG: ExeM/NucH family extracellular endonuclease, partial [Clostridiales bacterium]|nr:ExeM/NucH family extracellular endonuclease [Clostridiales bacterium]